MTSTKALSPELRGLSRAGISGALLALAAAAWVLTGDRMEGMDAGPGTELGGLGWFAVSWLMMMAAMMLPSLVPPARAKARAAGLGAYALFEGVRGLDAASLAWDRAGRYVAAGVILAAAAYELTSTKARCLQRCRTPLGLAREERQGAGGGLRGGLRFGAYCVGCCAGLMAALFALGVMSLTWMAVVAAFIAAERLLPWRTRAVAGVAAALVVLAIWMAVAPGELPGLTLPGSMNAM